MERISQQTSTITLDNSEKSLETDSNFSANILPVEILRKIIFLLPISDLKNVVLVCKTWLEVGSEPKLWEKFRLCINFKNVSRSKELLESPRMGAMKSVRFLAWFVPVRTSEEVIREISKHSDVEELIIRGCIWLFHGWNEELDSDLLSFCINKMKKVSMFKTKVSKEQVDKIFHDMRENTNLTELDIREYDLSENDEQMLAHNHYSVRNLKFRGKDIAINRKELLLGKNGKTERILMLEIREDDRQNNLIWRSFGGQNSLI